MNIMKLTETLSNPILPLFDTSIILIVDDMPSNLKVLSDTLADANFEVAIATSGEGALQQLEHTPVSLILLDVMMPGIDGFETCERLKANPATANIPVIFMTALSEQVNKVKGFELGAVDYITKPFQQTEVLARVRSHLKLSQLSQALEARNAELQQLTEQLEQLVAERTQELFASMDTLKQTQQLLRLVFDSLPQWVGWKDINSVYQGGNQSLAKAAGLSSPDELVGKNDCDFPWSPQAELYRSCDRRIMASGQAELHIIEPSRGADGQQIWLDTNKIPLRDANDKVFGILFITEDITERQQAQELLKQQKQNLEQALEKLQRTQMQLVQSEKMSALGNLVAGVAHEINNPLCFISANIEPALDYIQDVFGVLDFYQQAYPHPSDVIQNAIEAIDLEYIREDLPNLIGSMQLGVQRICDISTSLRTFSRADQDYKVPFNIHDGIDSTILILRHRLKANDTRPAIEAVTNYSNIPALNCFPGQLNQVFMNVLANAIDALEESNQGRSFAEIQANPNQITIRTAIEGESVKIAISDNGSGIPEHLKTRIFEHLFTTKGVGKGTGLGLAIARQIVVDKHGGAIEVKSTPGVGTEFILILPTQTQKNR